MFVHYKIVYKLIYLINNIMLKFKKVYIDSSYKVSGTSSEFTIDLPETVQLEDNMLCQIHEVSIPHSWYSINNTNNSIYWRHQVIPPGVIAGITYRKVTIPEGNYTAVDLAQTIQIAINLLVDTVDRPNTYSIQYNTSTNKFTISSNYATVIFVLLTDGEVAPVANVFSDPVDVNNLSSMNRVIGNTTPATDAYTNVAPYTTNFVDLVPFKSLYLHCNEISNYNQLTVAGNSSIVKKVNVTVPYLGVINDNELSSVDYIDVSGKMLRRLNFRLTNNLNQVVNLNDVDISFTLTFFRG